MAEKFTATICSRLAATTLALLAATPALAVDGVIEINQTRAVAGGVTPGDAPGLPVTISRPGSYRLTGNLATSSRNISAIVVAADDVTVDLNGFTIACTLSTTGIIPVACQPGLGQGGVGVDAEDKDRIKVRNGSVRGMGSSGIVVGNGARVTDLHVSTNGGRGIDADGRGNMITGNAVEDNGGIGILAGASSTVSGNTARRNGGNGIFASIGSTVSGNAVEANDSNGIEASDGSTVIGNAARLNHGNGIDAGFGCTVSGNTAQGNDGDGIATQGGNTVSGNTVNGNDGFGLRLGSSDGYRGNVLTFNNGGLSNPHVSGGIEIGTNVCGTNTTCP
jgi:parallel beta-helix repeat protein